MRNSSTISYLGLWEQLHNLDFNPTEFGRFKFESGDNAFTLTPQQWINATGAIGIISKSGRYGGTYAHTDIAFEFASWISPEFKLYLIKDYQRLKKDESRRLSVGWDAKRELLYLSSRCQFLHDLTNNTWSPEHIEDADKWTSAIAHLCGVSLAATMIARKRGIRRFFVC